GADVRDGGERAVREDSQESWPAAGLIDGGAGGAKRALPTGGVVLTRVDDVGPLAVEVELRGELEPCARVRAGAELEVDVHRPTRIPARVDGDEAGHPVRIGHLVAAQELLADGVEAGVGHVRVDAERVAVPDVDEATLERHA